MADSLGTQLNVRMSAPLKEQGDAALASIGLTASEAVRGLWEMAASGAQNLAKIQSLLIGSTEAAAANSQQDDALAEGRALYAGTLSQLGFEFEEAQAHTPIDDREALEEALVERMVEKGLA